MRRGVQAHVEMLRALLSGVDIEDTTTVIVADLLPNKYFGRIYI